jgi:hypothetical protein
VLQTASVNMRRSSSLVLGRARTVDARGLDACQFVMALIWGVGADFKPFRAWAAEKDARICVAVDNEKLSEKPEQPCGGARVPRLLIPQKPTIAWLFAGDGRTFD